MKRLLALCAAVLLPLACTEDGPEPSNEWILLHPQTEFCFTRWDHHTTNGQDEMSLFFTYVDPETLVETEVYWKGQVTPAIEIMEYINVGACYLYPLAADQSVQKLR